MIFIIPAYKPQEIQPGSLLNRDRYVFVLDLPAIGDIALRTDMAFISEEKVYMTLFAQDFKLFQLFLLVLIALRVRRTLRTKPYSFISRTNVFKKRRSVDSLTVRPVATSQFALATRRLCLSFSIALRTEASSDAVREGLRRCALLVFRPDMPFRLESFLSIVHRSCRTTQYGGYFLVASSCTLQQDALAAHMILGLGAVPVSIF